MSVSRTLLTLAVLSSLTFSCARRRKADIPIAAESVPTTSVPAPTTGVSVNAARDLTDVMTDELRLRPDQQTKVRAILATTVEQVNTAQKKYAGNSTALTTELKRINSGSEGQLKATLTPEQYRQYQLKKRTMQEQMRARKTPASQ